MNDWSLSEEEMELEQRAEMPTNMFDDPADTAGAEAALGPHAITHHLPKSFVGAISLQSAKPTAHPSRGSRSTLVWGKKEREGARGSTVSSSPA